MTFVGLTDLRLKFEIAEAIGMHVGDIEDEVLDADRNVIGYIVRQGIDGLSALELRNWRQLVFRRIEEERPK